MTEDEFQRHRGLVFMIAYDITGSVSDAEDVTQDVGLRWLTVTGEVENPRAYLARAAAHQSLNVLRAAKRRREEYPGPWLPDPLPTAAAATDRQEGSPESAAMTAEAVSMAMLVVLQSLSEDQRAAFVLRDVFDFGYGEIAQAIGASEASARQLVHRARGYVRDRRQRNEVDPGRHREVVDRFVKATETGNIAALLALMAPEVVLLNDGGGKVSAARRPVRGPWNVARFFLGIAIKHGAGAEASLIELNGRTGAVVRFANGETSTVQIEVCDGRIQQIFAMRNPDKLAHLS